MIAGQITAEMRSRFWKKVDRSGDCWMWTASMTNSGYGQYFPVKSQLVTAHRFSYLMEFGDIPDGMHVCHRCDNKRCVRPDHLFPGTRSDNMRDALSKGRATSPWQSKKRSGMCKNGHRATPENTYRAIRAGYDACKTCRDEAQRSFRERRRAP